MAKKTWSVPTLLGHLREAVSEATKHMEFGPVDIFNEDDIEDMPVSELLSILKDYDFRRRVPEIPGQTTIQTAIIEATKEKGA